LFILRKKYFACPSDLSWWEKKKDDGRGDPFKMFLKESLTQQRKEMNERGSSSVDVVP
jgi:hypothetical protein